MPAVNLDPAAALPSLVPLRAALAGRDWQACRRILDGGVADERTMLIRAGGEGPGVDELAYGVLAGDPNDSAAAALLAAALVQQAWSIRTGARAEDVTADQFARFHAGLRRAELVLIEAVARQPADPALWVIRLTSARGLELGLSEVQRRYARLAAIDPQHLPGQIQLLQSLCPKWSGTWELAHGFAREAMLAAPAGSPNPMLVAEAHVEHWFELRRESTEAAQSYLVDPAVVAEVDDAAYRSVLSPEFRPVAGWVRALSTFAFVFSERGDQARAAEMFIRLGPLGSREPWTYLGADPEAIIEARRSRALAAGARR